MIKRLAIVISVASFSVLAAQTFAATDILFDAADNPGSNPDASVNGEGSATTDAWTTTFSSGGSGSLLGGGLPDATFSNDNTWQIFTVSGQDSQIYSKHFLDSPLTVGQSITLDFANSSIAPSPGGGANPGFVGISLKDSNNVNIAQFQFAGGGANYVYSDANHTNSDTGHGFEFQDLMRITWTIGNSGTYIATLSDPGTGAVEATWSGVLGGNGLVPGIEVFNNNGGNANGNNSDVFYDDLAVVPEPSTIAAGALAVVGIFAMRRRGVKKTA
jgi:hypothetical protein